MADTENTNEKDSSTFVKGVDCIVDLSTTTSVSIYAEDRGSEFELLVYGKHAGAKTLSHYKTKDKAQDGLDLLYQYLSGEITIEQWKERMGN